MGCLGLPCLIRNFEADDNNVSSFYDLPRSAVRFDRQEKAETYRAARDQASLAVCELVLTDSEAATQLQRSIEQDLMAALAGLLRRMDSQRRSSR